MSDRKWALKKTATGGSLDEERGEFAERGLEVWAAFTALV
jgi:hypothetical protein